MIIHGYPQITLQNRYGVPEKTIVPYITADGHFVTYGAKLWAMLPEEPMPVLCMVDLEFANSLEECETPRRDIIPLVVVASCPECGRKRYIFPDKVFLHVENIK